MTQTPDKQPDTKPPRNKGGRPPGKDSPIKRAHRKTLRIADRAAKILERALERFDIVAQEQEGVDLPAAETVGKIYALLLKSAEGLNKALKDEQTTRALDDAEINVEEFML